MQSTLPPGLTEQLFTSQPFDNSTGLYYYNARYYDPALGQFTQPDSLVLDPLNGAAWNRYAYVYGNPVNHTDPTGHFIETPLDLLDLGIDIASCLGGDAWSCAVLPVDVAALAIPGVLATYGDQAFRAARTTGDSSGVARSITLYADEVQIARIYDALESTEAGADIIQRAKAHGLPSVGFGDIDVRGRYAAYQHMIILHADFRNLPPELAAPTLAHELTHRARRWYTSSLSDEFFAHTTQSRVWAELRGRVNVADLSLNAREIASHNDFIVELAARGDNALIQHLKPIYSNPITGEYLPLRSKNLALDPFHAKYIIPNKGW